MEREFSTYINYYIQEIARKTSLILNNEFLSTGITFSQFRVLNCIWKRGPLTQKEIHEIISVQPSTLTGIINLLEKKELVTRRVDNEDARIKRIHLTQKGKNIEDDSWNIISDFENEFEAALSQEEKALMIKWLKTLNGKL